MNKRKQGNDSKILTKVKGNEGDLTPLKVKE